MKLVYFVKDGCDACKKSREKVEFFLGRWGATERLERETHNTSTVDGLVEAAMKEVHDIPTVIIEDDGAEVARWVRRPPTSVAPRAALSSTDVGGDRARAGPRRGCSRQHLPVA